MIIMRFNTKQIEMIKDVFELFIVNMDDKKSMLMAQSIIDNCDECLKFKIGTIVTDTKKRRCIELLKAASEITKEYAQYAGDMAMINEYDKLKKECAVIADSIGDVEGQLRADSEAAKRGLDVVLDRIKRDLIDRGEAKSNAEAERMARVDDRYNVAMEDYRELCSVTYTMKNKFKNLVDTRDDLRQSVSTSRNSIIAEGYNK